MTIFPEKKIRLAHLPYDLVQSMGGPKPPADYESNGCTCSPDSIGGADLRPACHWHDWAYQQGGSEEEREAADRLFFRNLKRCGLGSIAANFYFFRVRVWGAPLWKYPGPDRPNQNAWFYFKLFVRRYIKW